MQLFNKSLGQIPSFNKSQGTRAMLSKVNSHAKQYYHNQIQNPINTVKHSPLERR